MRKDFIIEYLEEAKDIIDFIKTNKEKNDAKSNSENLFIAKVTSCLNLLRTSLEYCAQDVYEISLQPTDGLNDRQRAKKNRYFPYGKVENDFLSMVGSSLPRLAAKDLAAYNIIKSIQPFENGNILLYNFCQITNKLKHNTPDQQKTNGQATRTVMDNCLKIVGPKAKIILQGGALNGIELKGETIFSMDTPLEEYEKIGLKVLHFHEGIYTFKETGVDVINTLEDSFNLVSSFYPQLYSYLESKSVT